MKGLETLTMVGPANKQKKKLIIRYQAKKGKTSHFLHQPPLFCLYSKPFIIQSSLSINVIIIIAIFFVVWFGSINNDRIVN